MSARRSTGTKNTGSTAGSDQKRFMVEEKIEQHIVVLLFMIANSRYVGPAGKNKKATNSTHNNRTCKICIVQESVGVQVLQPANPNYICIFKCVNWKTGGFQNPYNQNPYNHNPYCVGILIGFVGILIGSVGILIGFVGILIGSVGILIGSD